MRLKLLLSGLLLPVFPAILLAGECRNVPTYHERLGLTSQPGVLVTDVQPNSIAQRSGLLPGDVILSVGSKGVRDIGTFEQFTSAIRERGLWDKAFVDVVASSGVRGGDHRILVLMLPDPDTRFGFASRPAYFVEKVAPGSIAQKIGLRVGDFIESIGGADALRFQSPRELDDAVHTAVITGKLTMEIGRIVSAGSGGVQWTKRTITVDSSGPMDGPVPPPGATSPRPVADPKKIPY